MPAYRVVLIITLLIVAGVHVFLPHALELDE
jgi:hypothetical protein